MKKVLKVFNTLVGIAWLLSAISLDSVSWLPIIVCTITTLYLCACIYIKYVVLGEVA